MSNADSARRIVLAARPEGDVRDDDFRLEAYPLPEVGDGEFLVAVEYIAMEPAMRGWMVNAWDYIDPLNIGDPMRAFGAGTVTQSRNTDFPEGTKVSGMFGWQTHVLCQKPEDYAVNKADPDFALTASIGVLGITSMTAYFAVVEDCDVKPGDNFVVTGAAGAVGSVAGQIARLRGAKVIGIAGNDEKCRWLETEAGFDTALNYKTCDVAARLKELCPDGINTFFDNVGGPLLNVALDQIAHGGTVMLCGALTTYNSDADDSVVNLSHYYNLCTRRAVMKGTMVMDHFAEWPTAYGQIKEWLANGDLVFAEDIVEGFENAPKAMQRLFDGKNLGKQLLKV